MKKRTLLLCIGAVALTIGASVGVQAAKSDNAAPTSNIKISKKEFLRMSSIISDVNTGKLPITALEEAQPLLDKRLDMLSPKIANELENSKLK